MISDKLEARGEVTIQLFNETGEKYFEKTVKNLVVDGGRSWIASRLKDGGPGQMTHMEIGSNGITAVGAHAGIQTPFAPIARVSLATAGGEVTANAIKFTATFPANTPAGAVTVREAGVFTASTGGTMLCRTSFPDIGKASTDSMTIAWTVSIIQ